MDACHLEGLAIHHQLSIGLHHLWKKDTDLIENMVEAVDGIVEKIDRHLLQGIDTIREIIEWTPRKTEGHQAMKTQKKNSRDLMIRRHLYG
jgi:hypothetical protein